MEIQIHDEDIAQGTIVVVAQHAPPFHWQARPLGTNGPKMSTCATWFTPKKNGDEMEMLREMSVLHPFK